MTFFSIIKKVVMTCLLFGISSGCLYAEALSNPIAAPPAIAKPVTIVMPTSSKPAVSGIESVSSAKSTHSQAASRVVAAQVVWVKGSVQAVSPDNKIRELQRHDLIYEHDTIMTKHGGTGQLVFSDNSLVSLNENTVFKVDQYRFNNHAKPDQERYIISVIKGGFRTVTGRISKSGPDHYKIITPVATIGVRGTEIVGHVETSGQASFSVPQGAADFTNGAGTFVLDKTKQNADFSSNKAPANYTPQPSPALKSVPPVQNVQASPDLIKQSVTTTASAPPPGPPGSSTGGGTGTTSGSTTTTTTTTTGGDTTNSTTTTTSTSTDDTTSTGTSSTSSDTGSSSTSSGSDSGTTSGSSSGGASGGSSSGVVGSFCVM